MKRLLSRLARCMGVVLYKFSFHIHADSACGFRQTISGAGLEAGPQQFFFWIGLHDPVCSESTGGSPSAEATRRSIVTCRTPTLMARGTGSSPTAT